MQKALRQDLIADISPLQRGNKDFAPVEKERQQNEKYWQHQQDLVRQQNVRLFELKNSKGYLPHQVQENFITFPSPNNKQGVTIQNSYLTQINPILQQVSATDIDNNHKIVVDFIPQTLALQQHNRSSDIKQIHEQNKGVQKIFAEKGRYHLNQRYQEYFQRGQGDLDRDREVVRQRKETELNSFQESTQQQKLWPQKKKDNERQNYLYNQTTDEIKQIAQKPINPDKLRLLKQSEDQQDFNSAPKRQIYPFNEQSNEFPLHVVGNQKAQQIYNTGIEKPMFDSLGRNNDYAQRLYQQSSQNLNQIPAKKRIEPHKSLDDSLDNFLKGKQRPPEETAYLSGSTNNEQKLLQGHARNLEIFNKQNYGDRENTYLLQSKIRVPVPGQEPNN